MDVLTEEDMRICLACKTLAWEEDGKTEWRVPEKLSPEEVAAIEAAVDHPREYPILVPHSEFGDSECCSAAAVAGLRIS